VLLGGDGGADPVAGTGTTPGGGTSAARTTTGSTSDSPAPTGTPGAAGLPAGDNPLPGTLTGTWRGVIVTQGGQRADVSVTLRAGRKGEVVGDMTSTVQVPLTGIAPVVCSGRLRLVGSDSTGVTLEDVPGSAPTTPTAFGMPLCVSGDKIVLRTRGDDTVDYQGLGDSSGRPTGNLRRA
jgi:hypothetical protein